MSPGKPLYPIAPRGYTQACPSRAGPAPNLSPQGKWGTAAWRGWRLKGGEGRKCPCGNAPLQLEVTAQVRVARPPWDPEPLQGPEPGSGCGGSRHLPCLGLGLCAWGRPGTQGEGHRGSGGRFEGSSTERLWTLLLGQASRRLQSWRGGPREPVPVWRSRLRRYWHFRRQGAAPPAPPALPLTLVVKDAVFP